MKSENPSERAERYIKVIQMRRSKKFQCVKCNRTFVHHDKAEEHVKSEHLDDDESVINRSESDDEVPKRKKAKGTVSRESSDSVSETKGKRKSQSNASPGGSTKQKRVKQDVKNEHETRTVPESNDLSCKFCGKIFLEECEVFEHEVATHWTCSFCQVQFMHEESWQKHQKLCKHSQDTRRRSRKLEPNKTDPVKSPNMKPYQKGEKFLCFASVYLGDDKTKKRFICTVCDVKYETMSQLKKHIQGMHTREKEHICEDCGKGFTEETKLTYHQANTCTKIISESRHETSDQSIAGEKEEDDTENLTLRLEHEDSYHEAATELEATQHDENTEVVFSITFDKDTGQLDSSVATDDSLTEIDAKMCTQCNMAFTYEIQRRQHMSTFHWGCDACCVQFLHEQPYQSHVKECKASQSAQGGPFSDIKLRRTYEGEDDFFKYIVVNFKDVDKKKQVKLECLVCGKEYFGQLAKMMRHVKSVHTKECTYICDTCSKPFADKDNLGKHVKKCTGKPWVPKSCPTETAVIPTVVDTPPEDEGITWACSHCMETFNEDYVMREHMSTNHWGCGSCWWQFLDDKAFQEHAAGCEDFKKPEDSEMILPETDLVAFKSDRLYYQHVKMRVLKNVTTGKTRTFECGHEDCQNSEHDHQTLSQLRKHIMYRHETKELKYQCTKCEIGFVDKFSLWKHNNKCTEGKEKIVISKLLSRIKPASGEVSSKEDAVVVKKECPECEEAFLYDHNYREHMIMKHWVCKPCRLQFLSEIVYNEHAKKCGRQYYGGSLSIPKINLNLYR